MPHLFGETVYCIHITIDHLLTVGSGTFDKRSVLCQIYIFGDLKIFRIVRQRSKAGQALSSRKVVHGPFLKLLCKAAVENPFKGKGRLCCEISLLQIREFPLSSRCSEQAEQQQRQHEADG